MTFDKHIRETDEVIHLDRLKLVINVSVAADLFESLDDDLGRPELI